MASEIQLQNYAYTGKTLYALIDFMGQRWNGTGFETVTAANWTNYAVALTEATGTGYFLGSVPSAITAVGLLNITILQQSGGSPALADANAGTDYIFWNGRGQPIWDDRIDTRAASYGLIASATPTTLTFTNNSAPPANLTQGTVEITAGTGVGQSAGIIAYNSATKTATLSAPWAITPDSTSFVNVYLGVDPSDSDSISQGYAAGATTNTLTFTAAAAPTVNPAGSGYVAITNGTGKGQIARILSYNSGTLTATIENAWLVTPDSTSFVVVGWESEYRARLTPAGFDDIVIEAGINPRQALSGILAANVGAVTGAGTNSVAIAAAGIPSTVRITGTVDNSGNRSAITLTLPT